MNIKKKHAKTLFFQVPCFLPPYYRYRKCTYSKKCFRIFSYLSMSTHSCQCISNVRKVKSNSSHHCLNGCCLENTTSYVKLQNL